MTDLDAWIRPPSERALQRRARRRLRIAVCIVAAFGFGLAFGWVARTPSRMVCYAPTEAITTPPILFHCVGESR